MDSLHRSTQRTSHQANPGSESRREFPEEVDQAVSWPKSRAKSVHALFRGFFRFTKSGNGSVLHRLPLTEPVEPATPGSVTVLSMRTNMPVSAGSVTSLLLRAIT